MRFVDNALLTLPLTIFLCRFFFELSLICCRLELNFRSSFRIGLTSYISAALLVTFSGIFLAWVETGVSTETGEALYYILSLLALFLITVASLGHAMMQLK